MSNYVMEKHNSEKMGFWVQVCQIQTMWSQENCAISLDLSVPIYSMKKMAIKSQGIIHHVYSHQIWFSEI